MSLKSRLFAKFLSAFVILLIFTGNFMPLKSSLFAKSLSAFVILLGLWSAVFMRLTKHHLKHSLSSLF